MDSWCNAVGATEKAWLCTAVEIKSPIVVICVSEYQYCYVIRVDAVIWYVGSCDPFSFTFYMYWVTDRDFY